MVSLTRLEEMSVLILVRFCGDVQPVHSKTPGTHTSIDPRRPAWVHINVHPCWPTLTDRRSAQIVTLQGFQETAADFLHCLEPDWYAIMRPHEWLCHHLFNLAFNA